MCETPPDFNDIDGQGYNKFMQSINQQQSVKSLKPKDHGFSLNLDISRDKNVTPMGDIDKKMK